MFLREWLLFRFVFLGDPCAFRRLKALCRLNTRKELKRLKETVQTAEELGLDPSLIVDAYRREKLQMLEEYTQGCLHSSHVPESNQVVE